MISLFMVTTSSDLWSNPLNSLNILVLRDGSEGKVSACNAGDLGLIPRSGRSPGEGNGNPLQYSCLENPMDGEAWDPKELDTTERLHFHFPAVFFLYIPLRGIPLFG